MAGTVEGGKQAMATNKKRYGENFPQMIGEAGGRAKASKPKGFAHMALHDPERHAQVSAKGGVNHKPARRKKDAN